MVNGSRRYSDINTAPSKAKTRAKETVAVAGWNVEHIVSRKPLVFAREWSLPLRF